MAGLAVVAAVAVVGVTGCAAASATPVSGATPVSKAAPVSARPASGVTAATAVPGTPSAPAKRVDLLAGISCAGGTCYAAGYTVLGTTTRTLVEAWNGKTWVREPTPSTGAAELVAPISCAPASSASANQCLVASTPDLAGSGGSWRIVGKGGVQLDSVSCPVAGTCVLAGQTTKNPVYATWNGRAFATGVMHAPPHSFQTVTVSGVSCASASSCVAVGDYTYGVQAMPSPAARDKVLAEQWNGRTWRVLPAVNVSDWNQLIAVSCVSATDCTAVGTTENQFPFAERWNGKTWKVESVPTVSAIGYLFLTGVSCPAAGFCVAVGAYQGEPVAETWNGSKWHVALLPPPADDDHSADLNGVSCPSRQACVAVGLNSGGTSYAEVYAGGKWHLSATVNPV